MRCDDDDVRHCCILLFLLTYPVEPTRCGADACFVQNICRNIETYCKLNLGYIKTETKPFIVHTMHILCCFWINNLMQCITILLICTLLAIQWWKQRIFQILSWIKMLPRPQIQHLLIHQIKLWFAGELSELKCHFGSTNDICFW